ncbi:amidohydrolase [Fulvivirga maritima]|uniref:amidohydrolase n=1 Tax=Fulvivirga maritima TaxID=2904247 RepID=UPI001F41A0F4|nr:amidohydrolase [Fulvivirga maritima]UII24435.1 amidohydrolase [Fulvivirga maritima]
MFLKPVYTLIIAVFCLSIWSCSIQENSQTADLIIQGGTIYTMNEDQPQAEAIAVKAGKIIAVGNGADVEALKGDSTKVIDLKGKTLTPGFIEGHGHFMGLGYSELNLNLMDVTSYDELVQRVKEAADKAKPGQWIIGRGWHQSKWTPQPDPMIKGFQTHDKLSAVSPDNPVYLSHASGHAGFANAKAMQLAGVMPLAKESLAEQQVVGGEIIRDEMGNPTGIFNERAMEVITRHIPENSLERDMEALKLAIEACHKNGITSFHDAGIDGKTIDLYRIAKSEGILDLRMYAMVTGEDTTLVEQWFKHGPEIDSVDNLLTIRSVKLHCDGALGSRGAWLLDEYEDRPGHYGMATVPMEYVSYISEKALKNGFQVCSHAIGDRTNHEILNIYENAFQQNSQEAKDSRFRIEHAQHLAPKDIPRFGRLGVIPAMQAIHMSSDRPWAINRLGEKRIKEGAYMWHDLLETGARLMNGTDVPVEPINPIASFYASVSRKTLQGEPEGGYEPEQKMTREQALKTYTLNAAYGAFEEDIKGSIEVGKLADFTVFSKDIMTVPEKDILSVQVMMTIFGGQLVYSAED